MLAESLFFSALLFTIGVVRKSNSSLFGPNTALSTQIFRNASQPFAGATLRQWQGQLSRGLQVSLRAVADGKDVPAAAPEPAATQHTLVAHAVRAVDADDRDQPVSADLTPAPGR